MQGTIIKKPLNKLRDSTAEASPKVFLLILTWNKPLDTIECIDSCLKLDYDNYEILVVDNHSEDDSVEQFKKRYSRIHLLLNSENLGYATGNNVGIRYALKQGADFVFILNNDTVVDPKAVKELIRAAKDHPEAGFLAPKVLYYDHPNLINSLGTEMDWLKMRPFLGQCNQEDRENYKAAIRKEILVGCALMVPKETIQRIGVIDDNFFIFHEEADWCFRNLKSGYENVVVPTARIYHKASKTMREFSALTHYYSTRNFLYMARRNTSLFNRAKMYLGLVYYTLKHFKMLFSGNDKQRTLAKAFFGGLQDYYKGRMGKCTRNF